MNADKEYCIILTTTGERAEADRIAVLLVERHLAACVQVMPIHSTYRWQGRVMNEAELLLLIKTTTARYKDVEAAIRENHSYEVPEIVMLPITQGSRAYLDWITENTHD